MVYYTCKVSFSYIMHIWDMLKMHIEGKKWLSLTGMLKSA